MVGGIAGLWENADENQPLIGFLIISFTHFFNFDYLRSQMISDSLTQTVEADE